MQHGVHVSVAQPPPVPRIVLDGIFFQLDGYHGIARVWSTVLKEWSRTPFGRSIVVLDRARAAPKYPGIGGYLPFRSYESVYASAETFLIEKACRTLGAELFISTFLTTPLETPSVYLVHDLIPELFGEDPTWTREKRYCTQNAVAYLSVSQNTARDLRDVYPLSHGRPVQTVAKGVDAVFRPVPDESIQSFKSAHGISRPYFLLVGRRNGYKNGALFFQAFSRLPNKERFAIVCCGGESEIDRRLVALVEGCDIHKLSLTDEELNCAYAGALALVYPSKYEGFGLPVLEAMAAGCPVITCRNSSIPEVAGEAAMYVDDSDVAGLLQALTAIQEQAVRDPLIKDGLSRSPQFSRSKTAAAMAAFLTEVAAANKNARKSVSAQRWREFRQYQQERNPNPQRLAELESIWLKALEAEARVESVSS